MSRFTSPRPLRLRELMPFADAFVCTGVSIVAFTFVMGVILFAALIAGE